MRTAPLVTPLPASDVRHCNGRRARRIVASAPAPEIAMRCLHHVFLRGGLAALLLASAGVGAWSLPASACQTAQADAPAPAARC
jgi:hypothetical protein